MRVTLVLALLAAIVTTAATRTVPAQAAAVATTGAEQRSETATNGGSVGTEIELVKWASTQGGLAIVLIIVLASYRRDFFRKLEAKQAELDAKDRREALLVNVLDKNADATLKQAVAVQTNTEATKLLAQNVNNLAERRNGHRG